MKIYEDSEIRYMFDGLLSHIKDGSDLQYLRTYGGSLSMSLAMRLDQLKRGIAKSTDREKEIEKLESVSALLCFTLNSSTAEEIESAITNAYRAYSLH